MRLSALTFFGIAFALVDFIVVVEKDVKIQVYM